MPLAGQGMLITWMDIDAADDADFNLWYDREHLAERVGIKGFLEARRWKAEKAPTKYFCTYSTETFEVLDSPAYNKVLDNQTDWSRRHIAKFRNSGRVLGRISNSRGEGRGSALGVVRMRPEAAGRDVLRERLHETLDPGMVPGVISMHLVESDADLSKPLTKSVEPSPGAGDWYVLIEDTSVAGVADVIATRFASAHPGAPIVSTGTYTLMWDLAKSDLNRRCDPPSFFGPRLVETTSKDGSGSRGPVAPSQRSMGLVHPRSDGDAGLARPDRSSNAGD